MIKQFTPEEIRRLVPEAELDKSVDCWLISGSLTGDYFLELLLLTRAQLEVAVEALEFLSENGNVDNLWRATEALAKINEMRGE